MPRPADVLVRARARVAPQHAPVRGADEERAAGRVRGGGRGGSDRALRAAQHARDGARARVEHVQRARERERDERGGGVRRADLLVRDAGAERHARDRFARLDIP